MAGFMESTCVTISQSSNKVRLDGRNFGEYRVASAVRSCFDSPGVIGSSRVQFGGTAVVCGINIMVGVPSTKEPSLGDVGKFCKIDQPCCC